MRVMASAFAATMVAAGMLVAAPARAATVTTFDFSGAARAGSQSATFGPAFPAGGVARVSDPRFNYAAVVAKGVADPFLFAAGAASAGGASATSNVAVTVAITNDTGAASRGSLSALIFAGGVGIANPDFSNAACTQTAIESCGAFLAGTTPINAGESAALSFEAALDGVTLYGGSVSVDSAAKAASFSPGFALNGFGPDAANANLFTWQETILRGIDLGSFAIGETKTLTFLVSASVATRGGFGCRLASFQCPLALAGFGDPPPGNGGVIIGGGGFEAALFSIAFEPLVAEVPLPAAAYGFGAGLVGLARLRRQRARG